MNYPQIIETKRFLLRPWEEKDATLLYQYASDPAIGPRCGWKVHTSLDESRLTIKQVLQVPGTYAITLKEGTLIGCISYKETKDADELEIGCWCAPAYWGHGYMPEAVNALVERAFKQEIKALRYCFKKDNKQSQRVAEKCGFVFEHEEETYMPLIDETWDLVVMYKRR